MNKEYKEKLRQTITHYVNFFWNWTLKEMIKNIKSSINDAYGYQVRESDEELTHLILVALEDMD